MHTQKRNEIVSVRNLTKRFGIFNAVDDISFSVLEGEIFAFLGPNGAGKSTTIKVLTTLSAPSSGTVRVNGFDCEKEKNNVRKSFGIVFQDQSIDDELTAMENMKFHAMLYGVGKNDREDRIKSLLKMVDLWDRRGEYVKNFSGGMKRRLEIARGLIHHPKIMFLDEPTLGLDPQTRKNIWEHLRKLNKNENMTIFFTTHYMDEAQENATKVAIIDGGKIICEGTVSEIEQTMGSDSLEGAFLKLTGKKIRKENSKPLDRMRIMRQVMKR
jgi:ABC-2 type transport system ATP-binding protein